MNRFLHSLIIIASLAVSLPATLNAGGDTVYDFLRMSVSARSAALGNTFLTMRNDPTLLFANPGALSSLETPSASIGFVDHLLDVNAGYAVYGQKMQNIGWLSAGVIYLNYGSMEKTDKFGNKLGSTFSAGDLAISLGYGNSTGNLSYGAALKCIYSYISEYNSSGIALDAGVSYIIPEEQIVLAAAVLNAGMQLSAFNSVKEDLPLDIRIGVGKKLEHLPLTVMLNFHGLNDTDFGFIERFLKNFSLGGEFELSDAVRARVGYVNSGRREWKIGNIAKLAGFSAGVGLNLSYFTLDYAWNSMGEIGALHRFSLGTTF